MPAVFLIIIFLFIFGETTGLAQDKEIIWIDTDPACGQERTADVDDCLALFLVTRFSHLKISGISTVFGNSTEEEAFSILCSLKERFGLESIPVYRGATGAGGFQSGTAVTRGLAQALEKEKMTLVALGPLTNIAALIRKHPLLVTRIKKIVAVAGSRPGVERFYPGGSKFLHLHDLNFRKDPQAVEVVLKSGVPLILIPYEVASQVILMESDLNRIKGHSETLDWLIETSRPWLTFWKEGLGVDGFFPFDALAIGWLFRPSLYKCGTTGARIKKRGIFTAWRPVALEVSPLFASEYEVTYCHDVVPDFKGQFLKWLLN